MSGYTQLTREQRYQIQALMKTGQNQTQMATVLDVHKATISRELRRNRGLRGYRPHQAQQLAQARQARKPRTRLSPRVWQQVETLVRQAWSPEQIRGRLKREHGRTISHEWMYQYIYRDKQAGGTLYRSLRCQKTRRKRYGTYSRRGRIANQISIDERPAIVATRQRIGDWEGDTVIGHGHRGALVTLVERRSKAFRTRRPLRSGRPCAEPLGHTRLQFTPSRMTMAENLVIMLGWRRISTRRSILLIRMRPGSGGSTKTPMDSSANFFPKTGI